MPTKFSRSASTQSVTVELEHVLSTLLDDVLFKYHQLTNYTTEEVLRYLLEHQEVKHWKLGQCDFTRYFHYAWENENILSALFSVPEPFGEDYQWTWDTSSYPWTLNLERVSDEITGEIRYAKNLQTITKTVDTTGIVTRLYALGAGEGVNQLNISEVNPTGKPYIDAPTIGEYGVKKYIWVDKRFEHADSLFNSAKALLEEWSKPKITYEIQAVDLATFNDYALDKFEIGKLVRVTDPDIGSFNVRVMAISKGDIGGRPYEMALQLANKTDDLSSSQSNLQRKQQINDVYAQGATNMLVYSYNDNADAANPAVIRFYIPDEMVNINKLLLTYETTNFRAYSRATLGGGAVTRSTSSGGASRQTSSSGGGTSTSTASGGGTTKTSSGGGDHRHVMFDYIGDADDAFAHRRMFSAYGTGATIYIEASLPRNLETASSSGNHTHSIEIPSHTHNFTVPNHTHTVEIPAHTHEVTIPNHTHDIQYGIYELDRKPTAVTVKVDGKITNVTQLSGENIDLIEHLLKDSGGRVTRGWHTVEIMPNDLGRINAQLITQFFIRSHEGVTA